MTTLLPVALSPFGHHHHQSKLVPQLKPRPLVSSTCTSMSMPILCLDRIEFFPIKATGSLPDLSIMVSAATESRHRASSLNGTFSSSLPTSSVLSSPDGHTPTHPLAQSKSSDCSPLSISGPTMTRSNNPKLVPTSAFALNGNSGATTEPTAPDTVSASEPTPTAAQDPAAVPTSPGRRRKNSSMTPVVPDLELMAQLRQEDEQKETAHAKLNGDSGHHSDSGPLNGDCSSECSDHTDWIGAERHENAAQWLAAALTAPRSPQSRRKNVLANGIVQATVATTLKLTAGETKMCLCPELKLPSSIGATVPNGTSPSTNQYKPLQRAVSNENISAATVKSDTNNNPNNNNNTSTSALNSTSSAAKPKLLQPFKEDRVRRTSSILRPAATTLVPPPVPICSKKKVSFADSRGMQLENVRYFANSPTVTRRFSSYHAPTSNYLNNGNYNSPWNLAINGNRTPLGTNTSINVPIQANPVKDYDFSHAKLAPRYELVATNFTAPSLQLNFTQKLEAQSVLLHSLTTAETTVYGTVSVMNLHFTKRVFVRYTFNEWQTHIEREATYMLGSHDGRTDKFSFVIYARPEDFGDNLAATFSVHHSAGTFLANSYNTVQSIHPRIYFALRFVTGDGREFWDSNDGRNYSLNLNTY